jgi:hypothetical protein
MSSSITVSDVKECKFFLSGNCKYGNKCQYLHTTLNGKPVSISHYQDKPKQKKDQAIKLKKCPDCHGSGTWTDPNATSYASSYGGDEHKCRKCKGVGMLFLQ